MSEDERIPSYVFIPVTHLFPADTFAPISIRSRMTLVWPCLAAWCRAERPSLSAIVSLAPFAISISTKVASPSSAACSNGSFPAWSATLASVPESSSICSTTGSPYSTAATSELHLPMSR
ncbi:hypothetical protein L798_12361 [Zootermopsis nevadensis]|uniref:Uncharacterized protein n=1 Tax=Zootermopsis nevadensis TaxID=136037 RepID=A0A067QUM3_ZOONE|nr:hypothetical protein L798_12361 [Zootermopsis nevadensis]